ncbi:MAG: DNA polymerase III subunit delta [Phycisphaerales bacterium]|nr:DNA polymerase III subunit delta [Phycisphaerales bacterium]
MAKAPTPSTPVSAASRILILHGKDRFLQDEHLRVLREALIAAHGKDGIDTIRFDGTQGPRIIADILDEARSFGLMRQHKIILVDNTDLLLKADEDDAPPAPKPAKGARRAPTPQTPRQLLEGYAADPSESAVLVLRASTWRPGKLDKAVEALPAGQGAIIDCDPPTFDKALRWAMGRAKVRHNAPIDEQAASMLLEAVGTELGRIDTELQKLAMAAGGNGAPITPELIESMVGVTRQESFFVIQDALLSGDPAATLHQLDELLTISRQDPTPIGWAYIDAARKIHTAARAQQAGLSTRQYENDLKIFTRGPARDQVIAAIAQGAKNAGPTQAAKLLAAAVNTDQANKSGLGDPVRNLETLTVRFAGTINPRR